MNKQIILDFLTKILQVACLLDVKTSQLRFGREQKAPRTVSGNS